MNLNDLPKSTLVEITRALEGSVGDTARLTKEHYVSLLAKYEEPIIEDTIKSIGISAAAKALAFPAPAPAQPVEFEDAAVKQLLGALGSLVKPGLDVEAISKLVSAEVARAMLNQAPKIKRIVVTGRAEVDLGEEHVHEAFDTLLKLAGLRHNILLVGPAGTGKTFLGHQLARALNLPFASVSCTAGMSESQLLGWLLPTAEGGRFEYVMSDFVRLYENGGVFLLDEVDASDANLLTLINQALANGGFNIPQRFGNSYVKRHPDFVCIAAANTFGTGADMMYAGRERLDAATLDRFEMVPVGYDAKLEAATVDPEILAWASVIRDNINSHKLRRVMSTRRMLVMTEQKAAGFKLAEIKTLYFNSWTADEKTKVK